MNDNLCNIERSAFSARVEHEKLLMRAEAAEAEVSRLKALLEAKQPAQPYTPRVGDVVGYHGDCRDDGDSRVVTIPAGDEAWVKYTKQGSRALLKVRDMTFMRRATAEERAAAGLPPEPVEAPAAPRVLPEHLAWIEAHAASWEGEDGSMTRADKAARALLTAVARRDGGVK